MKQDRNETEPARPATGQAALRWRWIGHLAVVFGLLALNYLLYARTLQVGFLSVDDPDYVQNNRFIENFSAENLKAIFTRAYQANYAPANLLSYSLDVALAGGRKAAAIHFSNVLWHGFVVLSVYLFALALRGEILMAAAAALLFLLHPAHVEVVAWISSRKDLVATGFAVLSMTCYVLWRRQIKQGPAWYGLCLLCFIVAGAGKQSVLLLPAVMLLWDVFVEKRRRWQILMEKVPFGLVTLFFGWMTWRAQPSTNQAWHAFVLAATELTNLKLLAGFGDFVLYRPSPKDSGLALGWQIATMVLATIVWVLPAFFLRRQPVRFVLCGWILVQMIPPMLLNFIVPITDRYLFLPSVGACVLLADLAVGFASMSRKAGWVSWGAAVLLAGFWGLKTSAYVNEWIDPRSVWYGAHLKTNNPQVAQFLGEVYQNAGDRVGNFAKTGAPLEVTNELRLAEAILQNPAQVEGLKMEWAGRGQPRTNSLAYRDRLWDLAWEQYRDALAHRGTLSTPNLFMNRGRLLVSQGKFEQAIPEFQTALSFARASSFSVIREETSTHALRAISVAYWNMRKYKDALQWMIQAREVQTKSGTAWVPTIDREIEQLKALAAAQP